MSRYREKTMELPIIRRRTITLRRMLESPLAARFAVVIVMFGLAPIALADRARRATPPESVFKTDLIAFPGRWSFELPKASIILVADAELETLATHPDQAIDLSMGHGKQRQSLRQVCESARRRGARTLVVAFDHFFSQYRPGQGDHPRRLMPDMDRYIGLIARVSRVAGEYGLGLELSLLSPLEIGPAYRAATGESGKWAHYRKGYRNPRTGAFSVQLWRQRKWTNNKGPTVVEDAGVRVFAFREQPIPGTHYCVVDPRKIVEIRDGVEVELLADRAAARGRDRGHRPGAVPDGKSDTAPSQRVRIHGRGNTQLGPLDRVLAVQQYRTAEMDYFSDTASKFLTKLIDRYADAGIRLNGLYADEMHIQQDWAYTRHHEHGEFAMRYLTDNLSRAFAHKYGDRYGDLTKYLVYMCHGQQDFSKDLSAKAPVQCVFGPTPEAIRRTALFRAHYFRLLQDQVVDLFARAKRHCEQRMGHRLEARAHPTWAESPTIDVWDVGTENTYRNKYEYTSNFVWSNTVHQAAAACYDPFKWGDFLTGNGNDDAEGGWLDRDYYGQAMACSTGLVNDVPYSYAAQWGMPSEVARRRMHINHAFGTGGSPLFGMVEEKRHRRTEVLMLYPMDLVAVEERFGGWMTQYAYADTTSQWKLLERGKVVDGTIRLGGNRFTTLVTMFEPFPAGKLLTMMRQFVAEGGRLVWSGPPPVLTWEGEAALPRWRTLFGVTYRPKVTFGQLAPGRRVVFDKRLAAVGSQTILTHFLVDRVYGVVPQEGTQTVARVGDLTVGTRRVYARSGSATFLGYRPRDDQSRSLGYEARNWFEVLSALGAYPATGVFGQRNDNPEYVSRTTDVLACRFPNGAIAVAPHFRTYAENWPGGWARDKARDRAILASHRPPSEHLQLDDLAIDGHRVTFSGLGTVAFRADASDRLVAFAGARCAEIRIDGKKTVFADHPMRQIAWAPVPAARRVQGGAAMMIIARGLGKIRIPLGDASPKVQVFAQGTTPGSRGAVLPASVEDGMLTMDIGQSNQGRPLYVVPETPSIGRKERAGTAVRSR